MRTFMVLNYNGLTRVTKTKYQQDLTRLFFFKKLTCVNTKKDLTRMNMKKKLT